MQLYEWLSSVATDRGSGKALVYRDKYLSWRGLLHRVDRRAQELHAMGIGPGAWVGLMLGNVPDFVILALALSKIEAVVVPAGSDDRQPRAGDGPGGGAAARAHHAPARRRRRARRWRACPTTSARRRRGRPAGPAVEVRARESPPAAGDAADVQPVQARAAGQPRRRRAVPWSSSPRRWAAIRRASSRAAPTWPRRRRRSARRWA